MSRIEGGEALGGLLRDRRLLVSYQRRAANDAGLLVPCGSILLAHAVVATRGALQGNPHHVLEAFCQSQQSVGTGAATGTVFIDVDLGS